MCNSSVLLIILMIALPAAAGGCVQPPPDVQPTADEFARRLKKYEGRVLALSLTPGIFANGRATGQVERHTVNAGDAWIIDVRWDSGNCDDFEAEVVDLLISVNRTIKESPSIAGQRECSGDTRTFKIAGNRFRQYRHGRINDGEILADIRS